MERVAAFSSKFIDQQIHAFNASDVTVLIQIIFYVERGFAKFADFMEKTLCLRQMARKSCQAGSRNLTCNSIYCSLIVFQLPTLGHRNLSDDELPGPCP